MSGVIFICTGNLCRSPSAEALLVQRLLEFGPPDIAVTSAGTIAAAGGPPERLIAEADAFGLDLREHQPRRAGTDDVTGADLVIGMTREHVREMVLLDPPSFPKAYTLREFVRRGLQAGARGSDEPLDQWLLQVNSGRRHLHLIGDSPEDDIPDPMGGSAADYRQMLEEVASLIGTLHVLIWG